jgi:glycosyltransferase involved in cell wall biosynthesis
LSRVAPKAAEPGWPWQAGAPLPGGASWPRLSIVTPSYNQGRFLEQTIRSVLDQGYPNLEYFVLDGGSTDGSAEIVRRYADRLAGWTSEPDGGQFDAINKGFARATGEIMAWLNADDLYCPWTFETVARIFTDAPEVQWLTSQTLLHYDEQGALLRNIRGARHARTWFYRGWTLENRRGFKGWIPQEATFWRRTLWEQAGGRVDPVLRYAGDFELWARFWQHADLATTETPLAGFRVHAAQKSHALDRYYAEADMVLPRYRSLALQNPALVWLFSRLLHHTGRGGRRFGSRRARVDYDAAVWRWVYAYDYCI